MVLKSIDWIVIFAFFLVSLAIGLYAARSAGKSAQDFFLSGRNMPWWLLGVSMVATTFACDTPQLVTDIVRQNGVAGNWVWWAFLLNGMLTVFVYAKLWRRSEVMTDLEFYELRYSGKMAAFLRGFRAIYLGFFFNIMVMATVCLAMIKISALMIGWTPLQTLVILLSITAVYSSFGGLKGILMTDFFQFVFAMLGSFGAAWYIVELPEVGGLAKLMTNEMVIDSMPLFPDFSNTDVFVTLIVLPLAVQWWSVWYPGAEPGGGGYIAQRMLSAKSEQGAIWATLLFNVTHYALRPWPWILVAMASMVVFPDLESMRVAFPDIAKNSPELIQHDFAYPAMLRFLPAGFLGVVVASLIAAFMSTISTQVNWGASYIVNDFYQRFVKPEASQRELVIVGQVTTVGLMAITCVMALLLSNALQAFSILLQIGAGTGLIFILRWFWWRINAYSELSAMFISFAVAIVLELVLPNMDISLSTTAKLLIGVGVTTSGWLLVTFLTTPTDKATLRKFYQLVHPGGPGWKKVLDDAASEGKALEGKKQKWDVPTGILCMVLGCFGVYGALFASGKWIYGETLQASILTVVTLVSFYLLRRTWAKLQMD